MGDVGPFQKGWFRLRSAWSRNDNKPREEWAPGGDLKETVMMGLLVIVVAVLTGLTAYAFLRAF